MKTPKPHPIEAALADLLARDIAREKAEGRHDNAKAIAASGARNDVQGDASPKHRASR